ncbi:hypothetical protein NSK_001862 [Nannochloropsis salina CCMP1776]|uniref:Uncharacterized protein n=1 Tax=Nannochloropsis salina CCMP1776 TaxID=1027361 RepID=A0A4D9D6X4_9STRA|nr:hypothetical protein NSK_001862 [Nannochloropsis salina CCMP1776]|eukprot:TFJ86774.1 hypothetical protein NSK_001862 [Nannochloropsis salina CCMP1776]
MPPQRNGSNSLLLLSLLLLALSALSYTPPLFPPHRHAWRTVSVRVPHVARVNGVHSLPPPTSSSCFPLTRRQPVQLASVAEPCCRQLSALRAVEIVDDTSSEDGPEEAPEGTGTFIWFRRWWKKTAKIDRKKLAALGASALCSYGLVSNINYCGTLCASYIIFTKKYNISPFAAGQWKNFLAVYGTLWAAMNFLRPLRVWIALGVTPYFEKIVETIRTKLNVKKSVALGITIFLVNVCGTFSFLGAGLYLSSLYTGVPLIPPRT